MAKDHLFVTDGEYSEMFRIQWYIAEFDDLGSTVGEGDDPCECAPCDDRIDWECWKAHQVAAGSAGVQRDHNGFYWNSKKQAQAALRLINAELKAPGPMPEWARQAIAAGWKAPKGWKP